jgi:hypothetical protein
VLKQSPSSGRASDDLALCVAAFNDRASYRVNDVRSMLLRDLVLNLLHARIVEPTARQKELAKISFSRRSVAGVESTLLEFAETTEWGALA